MKKLVLRKRIFFAATIFCAAGLAASLVLFALGFSHWAYCFCYTLMGGALAAALLFFARKKLIAAEVIVENAIIRIQPAVLCAQSAEEKKQGEELREKFGIFVSCFGILLGGKIIKFGQDGDCHIRLKAVEIGRDYLSIDYSVCISRYGVRNEERQNIRLLYSRPGEKELADIVEKFRRETGVIPAIA